MMPHQLGGGVNSSKPNAHYSSATARLLDDSIIRRSVDYKEPYEGSDAGENPNWIQPRSSTPFYTNPRPSAYRLSTRRWLIPIAIFSIFTAIFWLGRQSVSHELPRIPYFANDEHTAPKYLSGPRNTFQYTNDGRRQFVDILECYLRRNLAVNGGMLDEIHFLLHTDEKEDVDWLEDFVADKKLENYYKLKKEDTSGDSWNQWNSYPNLYKLFMSDPNTLYIKMDDDLVHIDDYAIPELVRVSLEHPKAHSVQSNNINNRWSYWLHFHLGAVYPYLADSDPKARWSVDTWRPSQLPQYKGDIPPRTTNFTASYFPPFDDHRWLPLKPTAENLASTPYGLFQPPPDVHTSRTAVSWAFVAQTHYSFFENLERNTLSRYDFGNTYDHTFMLWYTRWNINLMAIRGSYVAETKMWEGEYKDMDKGDEYLLTQVIPQDLNMPVLVATRAIAAHYSFRKDRPGVMTTDILDRYRAYANEMVCAKDNKKVPFGPARPHNVLRGKGKGRGGASATAGEGVSVVGDGPADKINAKLHDDGQNDDANDRNDTT